MRAEPFEIHEIALSDLWPEPAEPTQRWLTPSDD
jgi:hypothetical protein